MNRDRNGNLVRRDDLLDQLGQLLGLPGLGSGGTGDDSVVITTITTTVIPGATQVVGNPVATVGPVPPSAPPAAPPAAAPTVNPNGNGVGVTTIPIASSLLPKTTFSIGQ